MNQLWIVVVVLLALLLFTRIRARRQLAQQARPPASGPRIQGFQVNTTLHPRMSAACVFDHGVVFGRGFRRKEGPALPHDAHCRCEAVPFSFSSSEVFNGALRRLGTVRSDIAGLAPADAQSVLERLKQVEAVALPATDAAYVEAVGLEDVPAPAREAVQALLAERHGYLRGQAPQATPAPTMLASDGMETA